MERGYFITFEGGEGSGKSTQCRRLAARLEAQGHQTLATREPGGAPGAEAIRKLLVTGAPNRWSPLAETLLFSAARDEHLAATIIPALARGTVVICDRFADSTKAYQGAAGGVDAALIDRLEAEVVGATRPDLTFILDVDPDLGMSRAALRKEGEDRFERKGKGFHKALRAAFLAIAEAAPDRCVVIDASRPADTIAAEIAAIAETRLRPGEDADGQG
ncbi:Thymidylate kinase [hydrothermal vent metagenome]|uniref:dTMP kinase n=1 Tax=hydrothermal vent metagenome TaxID=652676 RepID=A0A3B0U342_9ZZZZ